MEEVRAFLKSKSAISSLSFSSIGGEGGGEYECEEKKSDSTLPKLEEHWHSTRAVPQHEKNSTDSEQLELSKLPTVFRTSKECEGQLVARIVPKQYSDYDTHKSPAHTDPSPFITSLMTWQMQSVSDADSKESVNGGHDGQFQQHQQQKVFQTPPDDESVVVLDLYLLRSAYLDEPQTAKEKHSNGKGENGVNKTLQQQRDQRIHSLMSSFDVTRNDSSHKRNILPRALRTASEDVPSCAVPRMESTMSTFSSVLNGKEEDNSPDISSNNIWFLHMNRSSSELAGRTLRRLELSTTRKLQSFNCQGNQISTSYAISKKLSRGKQENLARIHKSTSSKLVLVEDNDMSVETGSAVCREVDLAERSSAKILRMFSKGGNCHWAVALTIPKVIVPWYDNENENENEGDAYACCDATTVSTKDSNIASSSACSSSSSVALFKAVETIMIGIIPNPPTILNIQTFESFTGDVFTCVPIVIETTVIHATRAVITWFVDGHVALHDSIMYTPSTSDIGKRISILVTPTRPGHNGDGCQEACSFVNDVKPLPAMPIMELRDGWCQNRSHWSYTRNNLRVVTYNILADLYAGREIESHLMYSHCNIQDLLRQRRMPMIIAELLAYKADIICLQEVDGTIHDSLLRPVLEANGYQGFYSNKVSSQQEGCSMFWSLSTFELANDEDMKAFPLRSLLADEEDDRNIIHEEKTLSRGSSHYYDAKSYVKDLELERWESMDGIHNLFESHSETRKVYRESVGQIVQIVRLSPRGANFTQKPENIVVANTHLFYHPMADHIRVLQAYAVCHKLDEIRRERQHADPVLICGDFNSGPLSGAVRLLTHRSVLPNENDCWKHLHVYRWECGDNEYMIDHGYIGNYSSPGDVVGDPCYINEQFVDAYSDEESLDDAPTSNDNKEDSSDESANSICPPTIELPSSFPVLSSGCLEVPQFTNYAVDFVETLDYVFASKPSESEPFGFRPKGEAPMLTEDVVKKYVAMPNEAMPSDHVSVVCDFEWVKN